MKIPRSTRAALLLGGAAIGIAVQLLAGCPSGSMLWSAAFDTAHIPLYGFVAVAILYALAVFASKPNRSPWWDYALALAASTALGALTELVQGLGLGDADILDFVRDIVGGGAFLLMALAFDRRMFPRSPLTHRRRSALGLLAAAILAASFVPLTTLALACLQRNAAFPLLADFDDSWEGKFIHTRDAELEIATPPAGWGHAAGDRAARITFASGDYPALLITEPYPDWRGYDRLVIDVYSELDHALTLALRMDDAGQKEEHGNQFNRRLVIQPGVNRIAIPLAEVEQGERGRSLDMGRMHSVVLFALRPVEAFSVWVDGVRLERE